LDFSQWTLAQNFTKIQLCQAVTYYSILVDITINSKGRIDSLY